MGSLEGTKIKSLRMHATTFVEGLGNVPTNIETGVHAKWKKDLTIEISDRGYLCSAKSDKGQVVSFFIEGTNAIGATLDLSEAKNVVKAK